MGQNKMTKLNLGSGKDFRYGFINVDIEDFSELANKRNMIFKQLDLEKPLPFKDNSVDEVYCASLLEHIFNLSQLIDEIYRVCKPDAKVTFRVPHFTNNTFEFHIRPFRFDMLHDYCLPNEKYTSNKFYKKSWLNKIYFYKIKRKIDFTSIYNFMNVINLSPFLVKLYECTLLRSLFFANIIIFEARIYKK